MKLLTPDWLAPSGVRAVTTLRDAADLPARAEPFAVTAQRIARVVDLPAAPAWLDQVHGTRVVDLDVPHGEEPPQADAAFTRTAGRVCAIRTADCLPVLFAARDASVVGATHAGWRGLAAGVLEATITAMQAPADSLIAWLGPAIGAASFEVGDEVRAAFMAVEAQDSAAFVPNARGRWQCDLAMLARRRLARAGVTTVAGGGYDTFADAQRFHSYRRDGAGAGRLVSLVWLAAR